MPQPNDGELTRLFTASVGSTPAVEDDEPNTGAPGDPPATEFHLFVEGVAGNVVGPSGADYTLYLTHVAETGGPALANFVQTQEFKDPPWKAGGMAGNFVTEQRFIIPVPANAKGHVYHYVGRLVSNDSQIVSFKQSNSFILA